MPPDQYPGVLLDTHIYQMFSADGNRLSEADHIKGACAVGPSLASSPLRLVVGEWTPTVNDCAKYLNGRGVGSRYEGTYPGFELSPVGTCKGLTGNAKRFSNAYKTFLGKMWEAQAMTYEKYASGWIQWTWKTENADEWSYKAGLEYGWIPKTQLLTDTTISVVDSRSG